MQFSVVARRLIGIQDRVREAVIEPADSRPWPWLRFVEQAGVLALRLVNLQRKVKLVEPSESVRNAQRTRYREVAGNRVDD